MVCEDTQCVDVQALKAAAKLARSDNVDVIVGDVCSGASLAAMSVANKYQIPMVSAASTSTALSTAGDYFFRTVPSDKYQGQFAAAKMLKQGLKKVVVAYSDGSYGQSLSFAFIAAFTKDGGKAYPVPIPAGSKDVSAVIAEAKKSEADGIFVATNSVAWGAQLIKEVKALALPNKITFFNGDSMMDPTVATVAGKDVTAGIQGSDVAFGTPAFVAAFKDYTKGKGISYVAKAAHAYDATAALVEAYRRAAEPKDGPAILAELANVKFANGMGGPVAFDEFGDALYDAGKSYEVLEFDKDGQVQRAAAAA